MPPARRLVFELGRQALARPVRVGRGLVVADVADRLGRVRRARTAERMDLPAVVACRLPVERRAPLLGLDEGPAVGQPELGPLVAAVGHEGQVFADRDRPVGDAAGPQQHAVHRLLVVETEVVAAMADLVDAARQVEPLRRRRARLCHRRPGAVARPDRVAPERVLDIGQEQLLMLLLVIEPELDQRQELARCPGRRLSDHVDHRPIDVGAVARDLIDAGTRQHPARRAGVPRTDRLVIGIEQIAVARIEGPIVAALRRQHEGLKEPRRVCAMPFRRARVGHRLDGLILARQRRRERLGGAAHLGLPAPTRRGSAACFLPVPAERRMRHVVPSG